MFKYFDVMEKHELGKLLKSSNQVCQRGKARESGENDLEDILY